MKKINLATQILIGLCLGVVFGYLFPGAAERIKPLGDVFIRMIRMIVVPLVFAMLVTGICSVGDFKKVGILGAKTLFYFEVITSICILLGVTLANVLGPGKGIDLSSAAAHKVDVSAYLGHSASILSVFINIVPINIVDSAAKGDLLQIVFFAVLFGIGISTIGEKAQGFLKMLDNIAETMFHVMGYIMRYAPIGVFALIAYTVGHFGLSVLLPLSKLILVVYLGLLCIVVFIFFPLSIYCRFSLIKLIRHLKEELIIAFSTASSESVLPQVMTRLEEVGCRRSIISFVIPTGYTFNLEAGTIYQGVATIFIAQAFHIPLSIPQQLMVVTVLMVTTKGIAAVPGSSIVVTAATLTALHFPIEGLAMVMGIDRILDMGRTVINVLGNCMACVVMSKWEKSFDEQNIIGGTKKVVGVAVGR